MHSVQVRKFTGSFRAVRNVRSRRRGRLSTPLAALAAGSSRRRVLIGASGNGDNTPLLRELSHWPGLRAASNGERNTYLNLRSWSEDSEKAISSSRIHCSSER